MAGYGTGYPQYFDCAKARQIYYGASWFAGNGVSVQARERGLHEWKLTGRTKPTLRNGKGHSRKSWTTFEYECSCGHVGWSSHKDLERWARVTSGERGITFKFFPLH